MIYNFVLPEVEKSTIRKSIREKQQSYLQNAHAVIYDKILNLPAIESIGLSDEMCENTSDESNLTKILKVEKIVIYINVSQ